MPVEAIRNLGVIIQGHRISGDPLWNLRLSIWLGRSVGSTQSSRHADTRIVSGERGLRKRYIEYYLADTQTRDWYLN